MNESETKPETPTAPTTRLRLNSEAQRIEMVDIEKAYEEVCEGKHPPDRLIVKTADGSVYDVAIVYRGRAIERLHSKRI